MAKQFEAVERGTSSFADTSESTAVARPEPAIRAPLVEPIAAQDATARATMTPSRPTARPVAPEPGRREELGEERLARAERLAVTPIDQAERDAEALEQLRNRQIAGFERTRVGAMMTGAQPSASAQPLVGPAPAAPMSGGPIRDLYAPRPQPGAPAISPNREVDPSLAERMNLEFQLRIEAVYENNPMKAQQADLMRQETLLMSARGTGAGAFGMEAASGLYRTATLGTVDPLRDVNLARERALAEGTVSDPAQVATVLEPGADRPVELGEELDPALRMAGQLAGSLPAVVPAIGAERAVARSVRAALDARRGASALAPAAETIGTAFARGAGEFAVPGAITEAVAASKEGRDPGLAAVEGAALNAALGGPLEAALPAARAGLGSAAVREGATTVRQALELRRRKAELAARPIEEPRLGGQLQAERGVETVQTAPERQRPKLEEGGFTEDPTTGEPETTGFMVGLGGATPIPKSEVTDEVIRGAAERARALAAENPRIRAGGWVDGDQVYLEPSERFDTLEEALAAGAARGEKAVFDLATFTEHPVPESGGAGAVPPAGAVAAPDAGAFDPVVRDEPVREGERIVAAAVRTRDGKVFSGAHHGDAYAALKRAGLDQDADVALRDRGGGFVTSTGRFVSREEALGLAHRGRQIDPINYGSEALPQEVRRRAIDRRVATGEGLTAEELDERTMRDEPRRGTLRFEHYSQREDLTELDPRFMGTGRAGAEAKRPGRPRAVHVYRAGARPEPEFRNDVRYQGEVPADRVYDVGTDPDGIVRRLSRGGTRAVTADQLERELGKRYDGYFNSETYPDTIKLFRKVPVRRADRGAGRVFRDERAPWEGTGEEWRGEPEGPRPIDASRRLDGSPMSRGELLRRQAVVLANARAAIRTGRGAASLWERLEALPPDERPPGARSARPPAVVTREMMQSWERWFDDRLERVMRAAREAEGGGEGIVREPLPDELRPPTPEEGDFLTRQLGGTTEQGRPLPQRAPLRREPELGPEEPGTERALIREGGAATDRELSLARRYGAGASPGERNPYRPESPLHAEWERGNRWRGTEPPDDRVRLDQAAEASKLPKTATIEAILKAHRESKVWTDIRGKVIQTAEDAYRLLAPFRDPQVEKFHVVLLADDGTVVSHTLETSGAVDYVHMAVDLTDRIAKRAKRLGVNTVVFSHNHPSGNPIASPGDRNATVILQQELKDRGLDLQGHLVMDHDDGTWLEVFTGQGGVQLAGRRLTERSVKGAAQAGLPSVPDWTDARVPLIGRTAVEDSENLFRLLNGVADRLPDGYFVVYLDTQAQVIALEPHRASSLATQGTWVPAKMKGYGARRVIVYTGPQLARQVAQTFQGQAYVQDIISDAPRKSFVEDVSGQRVRYSHLGQGRMKNDVDQFIREGPGSHRPARQLFDERQVSRTIEEVAALLIRGRKSLEGTSYAKQLREAVKRGVPDVLRAIEQMPHAAEWYRASIANMEDGIRDIFPETEDRTLMQLFKAVTAITSSGLKPVPNLKTAVALFERFLSEGQSLGSLSFFEGKAVRQRTGRGSGMKYEGAKREGIPGNPRINNMELSLRNLEELLGPDRATWLQTMDDFYLRRMGRVERVQATGEKVDVELPWAVDEFGPKIGRFYANLSGSVQDVTVDVWATRTLRRWLGYGAETERRSDKPEFSRPTAPSQLEGNLMRRAVVDLARIVSEQTGTHYDPMDVQALLWYYEKRKWLNAGAKASGEVDYEEATRIVAGERAGRRADAEGRPGVAPAPADAAPPEGGAARGGRAAGAGGAGAEGLTLRDEPGRGEPTEYVIFYKKPGAADRTKRAVHVYDARDPLEASRRAAATASARSLLAEGYEELGVTRLSTGRVLRDEPRARTERSARGEEYDAPVDDGEDPRLLNLSKFELDPDAERELRATVDKLISSGKAKKRKVTWQETRRVARELGLDPEKILKTDRLLTEAELLALRDVISEGADRISAISKQLANPTLGQDVRDTLNEELGHIMRRNEAMTGRFIRERESAGRVLNSLKIVARKHMDVATWLAQGQRLKGEALSQSEVDLIRTLTREKRRDELVMFVSGLRVSSPLDKLLTLWKAGLLTGPPTHFANILGNTSMAALEVAKEPAALVLDAITAMIRAGMKGDSDWRRYTSKSPSVRGLFTESGKGASRGFREAVKIIRGKMPAQDAAKWDVKRVVYKSAFLQAYTDLVFNSLSAEDRVFRGAAIGRALTEYARLAARDGGLTPGTKAFGDEVDRMLTSPPDALMLKAIADAEMATFTNENPVANWLSSYPTHTKRSPFARAVIATTIPFVRTPTNVAARLFDYTPAGLFSTLARQVSDPSQKKLAEGLARSVTGSALLWYGYQLAEEGKATGAMPSEAGERGLWEAQGKVSNGVLIDGHWMQLGRITPAGMLVSLGAQLHAVANRSNSTGETLAGAVGAGGRLLTDQSFLRGVSALTEAIHEPERRAAAFTNQLAGSVVPSVVGRVARGLDPTERQYDSPGEAIQARIPGAREGVASVGLEPVPERIGPFGESVRRPGGPVSGMARAIFDPFQTKEAKDSPLLSEMERLGEFPAQPGGTIPAPERKKGTRSRERPERRAWLQDVGPEMLAGLERLVSIPEYGALSDELRRSLFSGVKARLSREGNLRERGESADRTDPATVVTETLENLAQQYTAAEDRRAINQVLLAWSQGEPTPEGASGSVVRRAAGVLRTRATGPVMDEVAERLVRDAEASADPEAALEALSLSNSPARELARRRLNVRRMVRTERTRRP